HNDNANPSKKEYAACLSRNEIPRKPKRVADCIVQTQYAFSQRDRPQNKKEPHNYPQQPTHNGPLASLDVNLGGAPRTHPLPSTQPEVQSDGERKQNQRLIFEENKPIFIGISGDRTANNTD